MKGKKTCEALKKIRLDIAKANGIKLDIPKCTHEGDCLGTCPRCESEVRYLERALDERRKRGLKIAVAGVSAGLVAMSTASCDWFTPDLVAGGLETLEGDIAVTDISTETGSICKETDDTQEVISRTAGVLPAVTEELTGELETEEYTLEGDIAFIDEEEKSEEA